MKVAIVTTGVVPNPAQSGTALTVWTLADHLVTQGCEVCVVVLQGETYEDPGATLPERVAALRELGVDVRLVRSRANDVFAGLATNTRSRLQRAWRPTDTELIPHLLDAPAVAAAIDDVAADVVLAYHWDAVAATRTVRPPRIGAAVDFPQLAAWYRWRATPFRPSRTGAARLLWLQARVRRLPTLLVQLMNECEASANFAAHHAAWLKDNGAPGCAYYRTPIEDRPGESWRSRRCRSERPRLLLIGHLRGTSTIEGLEVFAKGVLPRLERALGADGFEVRIVGAYEPPDHLRAPLARPSVRFLGHLTHVDDEFLTADALLVPTSIRLGTRVRILTAWSFGCPVVAHVANADGIPELVNGVNALLARDAAGLAEGVLRVVREPQLGEGLAEEGRLLYEACFAPAVAAEALLMQLERLAAARPVPIAA